MVRQGKSTRKCLAHSGKIIVFSKSYRWQHRNLGRYVYFSPQNQTLVFCFGNASDSSFAYRLGLLFLFQIKEARKDTPFQDIYDCFSRLYIAGVGKKTLESLILANVLEEFHYNRATLIYNLDSLFNYAELTKDIDPSLVMKPDIEYQKEYEVSYLLEKEKELFGFYLTSHPTVIYQKDNPNCIKLNQIENYFNQTIDVLILIEKIKIIDTKKGDKMAFISGSDETKTMEFTMFPKMFKQFPNIQKNDLVKIRGHVEKRIDQYQVIIEKLKYLKGEENEK